MGKGKKYNEIEVKDNMKIENDVEESSESPTSKSKGLKKVVSSEPTKVKKGLLNRLVSGVLGPDGVPSIGAYINDEIVKPAIKNIIVDTVTSGINMLMYGEKGGSSRGRYGSSIRPNRSHRPTINYGSNYRSSGVERADPQDRVIVNTNRSRVDEYKIVDRNDAAEVLIALTENADMYDSVSVADYYELIGVKTEYTDHDYGWTFDSITRASIVPTRGGYVIKFPPVEVI